MAKNFKKSKGAVKNYIGSIAGDFNSALSKLTGKFGSSSGLSNTFDQRIGDALSDLLTGSTGIRTSNIPEISAEALKTKERNKLARQNVLNNAGRETTESSPSKKVKLQYPEFFATEQNEKDAGLTNYIHFRCLPIRGGENAAFETESGEDSLYDIFLYVPDELQDDIGVTYSAKEKTILESIISKVLTFGEGTNQGIMGQIGQAGKEAIGGSVGKRAAGAVANPMKFQLFEGVEMRTFSYSFKLYPNSATDAQLIDHITYAFKRSALPGVAGQADRIYTFPNEWAIRYHGPIKKWLDFPMTSVLSKVTVKQSASRMKDGAPSFTELTLNFAEVMGLDRKKYDQRVSGFMNSNNNSREQSQEGGSRDDISGRKDTDVNWGNRQKDRFGLDDGIGYGLMDGAVDRKGRPVKDQFGWNPFPDWNLFDEGDD